MIKKARNIVKNLLRLPGLTARMENEIADQKILAAKALINSFDYSADLPIACYEFKVFSQWGDDGIIQYLVNRLCIPNKIFVEFGVENYTEANTRFLLINNNWRGLVMDGSRSYMDELRRSDLSWKYDLQVRDIFITRENINEQLVNSKFVNDVGLLSIDLDGNDYWIWRAISSINPVIVIAEYNSVFGKKEAWTVPYKTDFQRTKEHFSNLYFGASLLSLCDLAEEKGYFFIGCNNAGNNAYFVRKDKIGAIKPMSCEEGYVLSMFKESRDRDGMLSYIDGNGRLELLKGLNVYNTRTGKTEVI